MYVDINNNFMSLVRSLPIWPTLKDPETPDSEPSLKPASCGYLLPKNFRRYRNESEFYFDASENLDRRIFTELNVSIRSPFDYTFKDIEFPKESDYHYINFLKGILNDCRILQGLRNK